jgi:hypothetical protein
MGDRGNIVFHGENVEGIVFYTHWRGSDLGTILANAIARGKDRWDDPPYFLRIVFTELIADDKGETGYGISHIICDNDNPIYHVDMCNLLVCKVKEETTIYPDKGKWVKFSDFKK